MSELRPHDGVVVLWCAGLTISANPIPVSDIK
jgi:hypothetical protein